MDYAVGIKPFRYDKKGPLYSKDDADNFCLKLVLVGDYFEKKAKLMTKDAEKAIELTDDVEKRFSSSLDKLIDTEKRFSDDSKRISGSVRDAANKLADGLAKVEKAANFDRLERYVDLLERAAKAMTILSDLEKTGKLEKISAAIR